MVGWLIQKQQLRCRFTPQYAGQRGLQALAATQFGQW